jgi:hypothetical protein
MQARASSACRCPATRLMSDSTGLQVFLGMREEGIPVGAVTTMALIMAVARDGAWPLAEEILRASFADAALFLRLAKLCPPEEAVDTELGDQTLAILRRVREAREAVPIASLHRALCRNPGSQSCMHCLHVTHTHARPGLPRCSGCCELQLFFVF